jgi:hypothetical protein
MRYFKATIAYKTTSPEKNSVHEELTLFCCDDIFPLTVQLQLVFKIMGRGKEFKKSWWHEVGQADIPGSETIHRL